MKKVIFSVMLFASINSCYAVSCVQLAKNAVKTIGVCGLAFGMMASGSGTIRDLQGVSCNFYNIHMDSNNADLRSMAMQYQQGCIQYESLHNVINDVLPLVTDVKSLLKKETNNQNITKSMDMRYYSSSLRKLSYRLNDQIGALQKLDSYSDSYRHAMQSDFIEYIDKDDWYCVDRATCVSSISKIRDYLTEFRRYHVVQVPHQLFDNLKRNIESEKKLLDKTFPQRGIFLPRRVIVFQLKDITNITQQLIKVEEASNRIYEAVNPSAITKIVVGKASSLWTFVTRMFKYFLRY